MNVLINKSQAEGNILIPPSKSYVHRYILAASLANNQSVIKNIVLSDDIMASLDCISAFDAGFTYQNNNLYIYHHNHDSNDYIYPCYESGSTLRFFIPLALVKGNKAIFTGTKTLIKRGISIYEDIFERQGIEYEITEDKITINGHLKPDNFKIKGDISSQFITGLLFALPLLEMDSTIEIEPPLYSKSYIDITLDVLSKFGIVIKKLDDYHFNIPGNQRYKGGEFTAEGDASNAAFLDALNYLGGHVTIEGLNQSSLQGDIVYKSLFDELKNQSPLIDISDCIDLGPILFAMAALFNGATFTGFERLKIKESNRYLAMKEELKKFNVLVYIDNNKVVIDNKDIKGPDEILSSHNDHRIAMALSVMLTVYGGELKDAEAVKKSYPNFFDDLRKLNIEVNNIEQEL